MGVAGPSILMGLPEPVAQAARELVWALRWLVLAWSSGTIWGHRKQADFGDWVEGSVLSSGVLWYVLGPFK